MTLLAKTLLGLLVLLLFNSCKEPIPEKDMVALDRAFIPAFYYTYLGDMDNAEKTMILVEHQWEKFQFQHHQKSLGTDDDRSASFQMIDAWLKDAKSAMEKRDPQQAFSQLDHARYELIDLRWREGIPYFLDYLWELESAMTLAIDLGNEKPSTPKEWQELNTAGKDLRNAWLALQEQSPDPQLFDFSNLDKILIIQRSNKIGKAIDQFLNAVEAKDSYQFSLAAKNLEPAYLNYLILFGDFKSSESHVAAIGE